MLALVIMSACPSIFPKKKYTPTRPVEENSFYCISYEPAQRPRQGARDLLMGSIFGCQFWKYAYGKSIRLYT